MFIRQALPTVVGVQSAMIPVRFLRRNRGLTCRQRWCLWQGMCRYCTYPNDSSVTLLSAMSLLRIKWINIAEKGKIRRVVPRSHRFLYFSSGKFSSLIFKNIIINSISVKIAPA